MSDIFAGFRRENEDVYLIRYKPGKFRDGFFTGQRSFRRRLKDNYALVPMTDADVTLLPEGLTRVTSVLKFLSVEPIHTADEVKGIQADELEINGVLYRIDSVNNWNFGALAHYECIAVKAAQ